jgi:hypothetical protein
LVKELLENLASSGRATAERRVQLEDEVAENRLALYGIE